MHSRTQTALSLAVLACAGLLASQKTEEFKPDDFEIEGTGYFQCQCPSHACPCQTNGAPMHGTCYAADFAHIGKGHYGRVSLDGLNIALVGNLVDAQAERLFSTLYLDSAATPEQREALLRMMIYLNGQYVSAPGEAVVPFNGVRDVAIKFSESADKTEYELKIPDILEEKARLRLDEAGHPESRLAAMDTWSNVLHNADNIVYRYHDKQAGKAWDYSGHYANIKYFRLTKSMYAKKELLGQHGDMSGKWTSEQQEILRRMGWDEKKQKP